MTLAEHRAFISQLLITADRERTAISTRKRLFQLLFYGNHPNFNDYQ